MYFFPVRKFQTRISDSVCKDFNCRMVFVTIWQTQYVIDRAAIPKTTELGRSMDG